MTHVELREVTAEDEAFLVEMVGEAVAWRPDAVVPSRAEVLAVPEWAHYAIRWGRAGDAGVVALDAGRPVGAAWYRRFDAADPGYGFLDERTPELSIGVAGSHRGRGIGGRLLDAVIDRARRDRIDRVCLSVETDNPAARLYERHGFVVVTHEGGAWTMARTVDVRRDGS